MGEYVNPAKIFGENVFNDTVMQERLPKNVSKKAVSWILLLQIRLHMR